MSKLARFFALASLVGLVSFYQPLSFGILGLKPNWALIAVIAASFFAQDIWEGFLIAALAGFILKSVAGFEEEILIFFLISVAAIALKKYLPGYAFLNSLSLIALGTIVFYFILGRDLILSTLFLKEFVINLFFGGLFFALLFYLWQNKEA